MSENQLGQESVKKGWITDDQLQDSKRIQGLCLENGVGLPLIEVIIRKNFQEIKDREDFLRKIVDELFAAECETLLDPYGIYRLGWQERIQEISLENQDPAVVEKSKEVQEYLKNKKINITLPHIVLLISKKAGQTNSKAKSDPLPKITFATFCKRRHGEQLLPPQSKIAKICGSLISLDDINFVLDCQKEIRTKWQVEIPIVHLIVCKHQIDVHLLLCLLLAQLTWEDGQLMMWWGGAQLQELAVSEELGVNFSHIQSQVYEVLSWSYRCYWLQFKKEQETVMIEHLQRFISSTDFEKAKKIHKKLYSELPVSLMEVIFMIDLVTKEKLIETVLQIVYKMSPKKLARTMRIPANKLKKGETRLISKEEIQQGVVMAQAQKSDNQSKAAARLQELLKAAEAKEAEKLEQEKRKQQELEERKKTPSQRVPKAAKTIEATLSDDLIKVRMAIEEGDIDEKQVLDAVTTQIDSGLNNPLLDILLEQKSLSKPQYSALKVVVSNKDKFAIPKLDSKLDLLLANMLVDYNMVGRDRIQRCLTMQSVLQKLGIIRSLDQLIIHTKDLSSDMVLPLLDECKKKIQSAKEKRQGVDFVTQPITVRKQQDSPKYTMVAVAVIALCLSIAAFNILSMKPRPVKRSQSTENLTPVQEKPIEKPENNNNDNNTFEFVDNQNLTNQQATEQKFEKWRDKHIVSKEEKQIYEQIWKKHQNLKIDLQQERIRLLSKDRNNAILVQGKFNFKVPAKRQIGIEVKVYNASKTIALLEKIEYSSSSDFKVFVGPFSKQIPPNIYYIRVALLPHLQTSLVRDLLNIESSKEWWIKYVNRPQSLENFHSDNAKEMQTVLQKIRSLYSSLMECSKKPLEKVQENWSTESQEWQKQYKEILEGAEKRTAEFLIPIYPETEKQIPDLLKILHDNYNKIGQWAEGLSLFPVRHNDIKSSFDVPYQKTLLVFEEEKKLLEKGMEK